MASQRGTNNVSGPEDLAAVREQLAASKRAGLDFRSAWQAMWSELPEPSRSPCDPRRVLRSALHGTRPAWQSAYELTTPEPGHVAAARLVGMLVDSDYADDVGLAA